MFRKILIANRGEIACRIMRACRALDIGTVAVYSEIDAYAPHAEQADEAYSLGSPEPSESYLNGQKIIEAALEAGAEAIHPGYGFLSENSQFVKMTEEAGLVFIGASSEAVGLMGDKIYARNLAVRAGLPVIPGPLKSLGTIEEITAAAQDVGYPLLLKAAFGGGGKGMRVVPGEEDLERLFREATSEAKQAFGNGTLFVEKYLTAPRHIEVQIMADHHGNVVYLGERECSIQRRHQKLIEETPSPVVDEEFRRKLGEAACKLVRESGYTNAGTVEFLVDQGEFYFLEMNARLQVEHPVTEMVTGIDLVKEQILAASGEKLSFAQDHVKINGSAIECRIYAEDPAANFAPSPGRIELLELPHAEYIRNDIGIEEGNRISLYYDPLIAKLIVWGENRKQAVDRMEKALKEYVIIGPATTIPFHLQVMQNSFFRKGDISTRFIDEYLLSEMEYGNDEKAAALAGLFYYLEKEDHFKPEYQPSTPWKIAGIIEGAGK